MTNFQAPTTASIPPEPIQVFISYSHQDEGLREELVVHLSNLRRQGIISAWHDRAIEAGTEWEAQIKEHLESAQVILLLISPPFMASAYCYDIEMQRAIERHDTGTARVIPIILRPVDWKDTPFSKLQALPKDALPVTKWSDRDSAFLDVVQGIRRAVESLPKTFLGVDIEQIAQLAEEAFSGDTQGLGVAQVAAVGDRDLGSSGFITGVPIAEPRHFFGRERELKRLFNLLKTHPLQNAAIIGKPRSGKTSLLNYLRSITKTPVDRLRPGQKSDWLPDPQRFRWIFVDFQDVRMQQEAGLLRFLLESMGLAVPEPCDLERFMERVSGRVLQPTVILLDEIGVALQRCPELDDNFWESLRSLATNQTGGNLAFVLAAPESPIDLAHHTGHSSPFFNIFGYTATLGPLTEAEARALIASSPLPFADDDADWILNHSGRWPLLLQILCRTRLFDLAEGDAHDDWQAEGLQQIMSFRHLLD
jgi:hypothetical protein